MNNPKHMLWDVDIDTIIEVFELAKKHGKKPGDSCQEEFDEVLKNKPNKFKALGTTDKDIDIITGNLREQGNKVFNLKEWERQHKKGGEGNERF